MTVVCVLGLLVSLEPLSSAYQREAFDHARRPVVGTNLSEVFEIYQNQDSSPLDSRDLEALRQLKVVMVPGFLSDVGSGFKSRLARLLPWLFKNKDPQSDWFSQNGIEVVHVDIESEAAPEVNAPAIQKVLRESERRVLLISHSKGGLDILEALIQQPELASQMSGWLALQAPFYGTPVSDVWTEAPLYRQAADKILSRLGGSVEALLSMRMEDRLSYMERHRDVIAKIQKRTSIVSFGGHAVEVLGQWDTVFEPYFRDQLALAGIESDGLVPWRNSILPEGSYVVGHGIDHLMPIGSIDLTSFDRVRFLQALLKVLLLQKES